MTVCCYRTRLAADPVSLTRAVVLLFLVGVGFVGSTLANSVRPMTPAAQTVAAAAVCRGTMLGNQPFADVAGHIFTRATVRVDEGFKGTFPGILSVVHRGGVLGRTGEFDSGSPAFAPGDEVLLFLRRRADGSLYCLQGPGGARKLARPSGVAGDTATDAFTKADMDVLQAVKAASAAATDGADVTDQAAVAPAASRGAGRIAASASDSTGGTGFIPYNFAGDSYPSRFVQQDQGLPIPYLVDADHLPSGITQQQALNAIADALAAWSAVTSLKFKFEGVQSFGMAAPNVPASDGKIRIQLHDQYNFITDPQVLGRGGALANEVPLSTHWGFGGNVNGQECHKSVSGSVVIKHTESFFTGNPVNLAEIICHEVGHVLGLAHSSNTFPESDPSLAGAIMYFETAGGSRGAVLGSYDGPQMRKLYPSGNTPPFSFDRIIRATSIFGGVPNIPGINEVELRGYDLQPTTLSVATFKDPLDPSNFVLQGSVAKYIAPAGSASDEQNPIAPDSGEALDRIYYRFSDGLNSSPFNEARVISLSIDTKPSGGGDGIPDNWQLANFGNIDPNVGTNAKPGDDFDNDGFTNFQEYLLGTNPKQAGSRLQLTGLGAGGLTWQATPFDLYEVQASTDLVHWLIQHPAVVPTTTTGTFTALTNNAPQLFFRVIKVP